MPKMDDTRGLVEELAWCYLEEWISSRLNPLEFSSVRAGMQMGHKPWKPTVSNFENDCAILWPLWSFLTKQSQKPRNLKNLTPKLNQELEVPFRDSSFGFCCCGNEVNLTDKRNKQLFKKMHGVYILNVVDVEYN